MSEKHTPTIHIYKFDDPRTREVIYVGMTSNPKTRFKKHLSPKGLLYPLAQELRSEGIELTASIVATVHDEQEARALEKKWIHTTKPLLNSIHNQEAMMQRYEEECLAQKIAEVMENKGFSHREAVIYVKCFCASEGDAYNYAVIEEAAQITNNFLGMSTPLSGSEILRIALRCYGIEGGVGQ